MVSVISVAVGVGAGLAVGAWVSDRRSGPYAPLELTTPAVPPSELERCHCGCVALRVRMAHLEQMVDYWRTEAS